MKKYLISKKLLKGSLLIVFTLFLSLCWGQSSGDFVIGTTNSWIIHAPQDTRTNLHIAPKVNNNWKWGTFRIEDDGKVYTGGLETYDLKSYRSVEIDAYTNGASILKMLKPNGGFHSLFSDNNTFGIFNSITNRNALVINDQDNVGIGTSSPNERLAVNGNIRAKEIRVEAGPWPDYVFEEDYALESLPELEQFVKKNKHLPGMPKATDVEDKGISLGEMNRILLQKVEELTLHLIEKDKEVKAMGKRIENLELLNSKNQ